MARNAPRELERVNPVQERSTSDIFSGAGVSKTVLDNVARIAADNAVREVGTETFTCYLCGGLKSRNDFYISSDKRSITGVTRICKECARKIAHGSYEDGLEKDPTADSIYSALEYLDFPWSYEIYGSAVEKSKSSTADPWSEYMALLGINKSYKYMRFKDSDAFNKAAVLNAEQGKDEEAKNVIDEEFEYNRRDVIRMVGYDPFENYPIINDLPRLYAQLITFIDEETKNDGMKMGAVIQIVKKLNQAEKINAQIDYYVNDADAVGLVDKLASSSQKLMQVANTLAKDNGISVNFNNNKSAGASTLSGKIKKLTEMGLRSAKINTFDIGTCEGMRQVAEINEEARHKRIGYDENIAAEIKDIKVELVEQAIKDRDEAKETARLLLQENKDLKNYLKKKNLLDEDGRGIE